MPRRSARKTMLVPTIYGVLAALAALPVACATASQENAGDTSDSTSSSSSSSSGHPFPVGVGVGVGVGASSSSGAGGASGSGGAGGANSANSASGTGGAGSTSASSGGSGGAGGSVGPTCDNSGDCQACVNCAVDIGGPCETEYDVCFLLDVDCTNLVDCLNLCDPADPAYQTCVDACATKYQAGIPSYNSLVECAFCASCFNDCDGANNGC